MKKWKFGTGKFGTSIILQVGIKLLAVSLGFFTTRWLIDKLNVSEYESYNLIITYTGLVLTIIYLGLPNLIQKFYTNQKDQSKLADIWSTFAILRLASFFVGLVIIVLTYPLSQTQDLKNIIVIFSAQFILLADLNYRSVCDARQTSWQFSLTDFAGKLLLVLFLFGSAWLSLELNIPSLTYFGLASILSYGIALFLDFLWQKPHTKSGQFRFEIVKQNSLPILYLTLSGFIVATFLTTDKLFLKYFGFPAETINGYANAYKLLEIATIVPSLITPTLASWIKNTMDQNSQLKQSEVKKFLFLGQSISQVFQKLQAKWVISIEWSVYILLLGLVMTLSMLLFGNTALWLIDPTLKYPVATQTLFQLSWTLIPLSLMSLYTHLIILFEGERDELISMTLAGVFQISLYLTLIPKFGATGAAWSTVAMFVFAALIKMYLYFMRLKKAPLV